MFSLLIKLSPITIPFMKLLGIPNNIDDALFLSSIGNPFSFTNVFA